MQKCCLANVCSNAKAAFVGTRVSPLRRGTDGIVRTRSRDRPADSHARSAAPDASSQAVSSTLTSRTPTLTWRIPRPNPLLPPSRSKNSLHPVNEFTTHAVRPGECCRDDRAIKLFTNLRPRREESLYTPRASHASRRAQLTHPAHRAEGKSNSAANNYSNVRMILNVPQKVVS